MQVISINVGELRTIPRRGHQIKTGIFKQPIEGTIAVQSHGLDGDAQGDLTLHGGTEKAIYVYPKEHYKYWGKKFPELNLSWGIFGENLTIEGASEDTVYIGDQWQIGSAKFEVVEPREPCYKLGVSVGNKKIVKQFSESGRSGWYLRVIQEGEIKPSDTISVLNKNIHTVTVTDLNNFFSHTLKDMATLQRALQIETLSPKWRDSITQHLQRSKT